MRRPAALLVLLLFALPVPAQDRDQNLAILGRIWGIARYAHPWIDSREIDFDAAALQAIGRVRNNARLSDAVDGMLAVLRDDATFVSAPCMESNASSADRSTRMLADGVVYLSALNPASTPTKVAIYSSHAAVVDLRPQPGRCSGPALASDLVPLLFRSAVTIPAQRLVAHRGYRSQLDGDRTFDSFFADVDRGIIVPEHDATIARTIFIVDEHTHIPEFAAALAANEMASFVSVGRFPLHTAVGFTQIGLPDQKIVTLRTGELVENGQFFADPTAAMTLPANATDDEARAAALQLTRGQSGRRRTIGTRAIPLPQYRWRADATYADTPFPDPDHRILGAYRLWNVLQFFAGDRESTAGWDAHLQDAIARIENVTSRTEYELALAGIVALFPDNQAFVDSSALRELRGDAAPPFRLMLVENKPVVIESNDDDVKPGDELLRIDNADVNARMATLARYMPRNAVLRNLANGANGTTATFTFRRADGSQYDAPLPRGIETIAPTEQAWRILDGNVAYVDLSALAADDVDALFSDAASARSIIFDARKGAGDAGEALASRLIEGNALAWTTHVPYVVGGDAWPREGESERIVYGHQLYDRDTFVLVDARTDGTAEETALMLQAVGAEIVGTNSGGASALTSTLIVPGNIAIRFSATDLRGRDFNRLQGVGVTPDHEAAPTIRGLSEGRDEVVEAVMALLR